MVLLPWQSPIHGTPGLGNGLWALPWTSCCSELREPHCNTAENPGSLLGKCCSCSLQHLHQDRMAPGVSLPWLFQDGLWREQSWGSLHAEDEEHVPSHGAVPASVNRAIAPSWAWGHQLVTLNILGASSSWLFLSCMLFHHHWALSCVLQKSFLSCLLLKSCPADNPLSKIPAGSQIGVSKDPPGSQRGVSKDPAGSQTGVQLCCRCWFNFKSLKFLHMVPLLPLPQFPQPQKAPGSWKPFLSTCREGQL